MSGDIMHAIRFRIGRLFKFATAFVSAWMLTASAPLLAQSSDASFDSYVQSLWPKGAGARRVAGDVRPGDRGTNL
jgi:membrane-bound lytic murein transglycosylase B